MQHRESSFESNGGIHLYQQSWLPEGESKANVVLVHGFGEHSGRYVHVAEAFNESGIALYGYDMRGHGKSEGKRGDIPSWQAYRDDLKMIVDLVREESPHVPLFLYGQSMGGCMAVDYSLHMEQSFHGLITTGPLLGQAGVSQFLVLLSKLLTLLAPGFQLDVNLDVHNLSRDPAVVQAYVADPLVHGKGTPRLGTALTETIEACQRDASLLQVPFLTFFGDADQIAPPLETERFYSNLLLEDKTKYVVRGGYHEPHNDLEKAEVLAVMTNWIMERL